MQSIAQQLAHTREALSPVAGALAGLEARMLAAHAWDMTPEALVMHAEASRDEAPLHALLSRRLQHEPVAQIIGIKDFWRDQFVVTQDVLTPRADTETMLEALLRHRPDTQASLRLLDLGTGSGCLLLSALREYTQAQGVGVDQSPAALNVAQQNAVRLGLAARSLFVEGNWCGPVSGLFDVVVSNPPYIPTADIAGLDADVRLYEPHAALDGGVDGLDCYRTILQQLGVHLNPNALILFEVGQGQADDVAKLGVAQGYTLVEISTDLAGIGRVVVLQTK